MLVPEVIELKLLKSFSYAYVFYTEHILSIDCNHQRRLFPKIGHSNNYSKAILFLLALSQNFDSCYRPQFVEVTRLYSVPLSFKRALVVDCF